MIGDGNSTTQRSSLTSHRAVLGHEDRVLRGDQRPAAGPIAILPAPQPIFVDAVTAAGGELGPLSQDTRGLIWLGGHRGAELGDLLTANPQIQWVQLPSAGVDAYIPVFGTQAPESLPVWTSAKGAYSQPVAEHALALSLALMRFLPRRAAATSWETEELGVSLYGRSVVLIGAGGIAKEFVRLLEPFEADITVVRRSDTPMAGVARTVASDRLLEVLPGADLVVIAAAFTDGTAKLFGAAEFAAMKKTAYLVNIARGGLVDTDALVTALAEGEIAGAGLDVTDPEPLPNGHPLWSEPRALITPHQADTPEMTEPLLAERVRANVRALLGDGEFVGIVDTVKGY
jgi:phosphoglycerate dehydrogenase-like enzyme